MKNSEEVAISLCFSTTTTTISLNYCNLNSKPSKFQLIQLDCIPQDSFAIQSVMMIMIIF